MTGYPSLSRTGKVSAGTRMRSPRVLSVIHRSSGTNRMLPVLKRPGFPATEWVVPKAMVPSSEISNAEKSLPSNRPNFPNSLTGSPITSSYRTRALVPWLDREACKVRRLTAVHSKAECIALNVGKVAPPTGSDFG